jgi:hypothetical protein
MEQSYSDNQHGYQISLVADGGGKVLPYQIVGTMMRIDLPAPLKTGKSTSVRIDWFFTIIEEVAIGGRGGYEFFEETDTNIFFLAQWYPRLAAYTDYTGWQHKQFLGRGEFTLEFGDYDVSITVPEDHIVSASGELQNPGAVLSNEQKERLDSVNADKPIFIVTPEEALKNESSKARAEKTWRFKAENVRDFAWASSRKFIWDAMLHEQKGAQQEEVLAMSFYPNEAEPIWSHYSTHAVIHTMDVYSRFTFDYPYPTAQSVNTWKSGGMEYPMISFNGYRPTEPDDDDDEDEDENEDGGEDEVDEQSDSMQKKKPTYSRNIKYGLIGVVIHEVGHNYFPMIVNSDERRWTWMDEGLNSFLEYLAELEWEEGFPAYDTGSNVLDYIPDYMTSQNQVPIMTQSDSILQFGPNAYSKPTAALTVLRETVMGRESFDFAFRQYAERWKFKRPTPADFFRTMEDASGVDLDWFWRGWFYSTDHVDIAITDVREYRVKSKDPELDFPADRNENFKENPVPIMQDRNRNEGIKTRLERYPGLSDLYNENDEFTVSNKARNDYQTYLKELKNWERKALDRIVSEQPFIYFVDFTNIGGLVSPIPLVMHYEDGSSRELMIPAEIWRRDAGKVTRLFIENKAIKSLSVDDRHQTAEANFADNSFPPKITPSRLELYKSKDKSRDLMANLLVELKGKHKGDNQSDEKEVPLEPVKP